MDVLSALQSHLKFDAVCIDNNVFRLHYKATVMVFTAASILVTSGQYFGDPIDCMVDGVPGGIMDTYCWIHSTFSIPTRWVGTQGVNIPHKGVAPIVEGEEVKHHAYYQWVAFFLVLQALLFSASRYIWKMTEGGKVSMLVQDLKEPMLDDDKKEEQIGVIVKYFRQHRGTHGMYAIRFFLAEIFNFVNVIVQMYFIDFFLGGEFTSYGTDVLNYTGLEHEDRPDPMAKVFPKVTKCTFHKYGTSGTVEKSDGLCVLPLNIINEKIFIFVWFWLIFVAVVSGMFIIYRIFVLAGAQMRTALITYHGGKSCKRSDVETILEPPSMNYLERLGDWFLLHLICKNLNVLLVNDLIRHLHKEQEGNNSNTETLKLRDPQLTSNV